MGNAQSPITCGVKFDGAEYSAGDTVTGTVFVFCTRTTVADSVDVSIFGREKTCVHYTTTHTSGKCMYTQAPRAPHCRRLCYHTTTSLPLSLLLVLPTKP